MKLLLTLSDPVTTLPYETVPLSRSLFRLVGLEDKTKVIS